MCIRDQRVGRFPFDLSSENEAAFGPPFAQSENDRLRVEFEMVEQLDRQIFHATSVTTSPLVRHKTRKITCQAQVLPQRARVQRAQIRSALELRLGADCRSLFGSKARHGTLRSTNSETTER